MPENKLNGGKISLGVTKKSNKKKKESIGSHTLVSFAVKLTTGAVVGTYFIDFHFHYTDNSVGWNNGERWRNNRDIIVIIEEGLYYQIIPILSVS